MKISKANQMMRNKIVTALKVCLLLLAAAHGARAQNVERLGGGDEPAGVLGEARAAVREAVIKTQSILKVNVTYQAFSAHIPWQKDSPGARRGLGAVLTGNRVLVTAQMVADATYIEFEQPESGQKLTARVRAVDYDANLALLVAESPARQEAFFAGLKAIPLDTSARIGDPLNVWQIGPVGDLIVSPLRVAKVETSTYFVPGSSFLVYECNGILRTEANSFTLPVVKGGRLAGLLLRYDSKNQVTTVLPAPIIEHFLKDTDDGEYLGFPNLGVEFQTTLDEQFRDYLGMKPGDPGMYISRVMTGMSGEAAGLREGDIVTRVNGFELDSRGNYKDPQFGTLSVSHIVRGKAYVGDKLELEVVRDGKAKKLSGVLDRKKPSEMIVEPYRFDRGPNFLLAGGLLFQELSQSYLDAFGRERRSGTVLRLSRIAKNPEKFEDRGCKKIIFVSAVLPTPSAQGYERLGGQILETVNGVEIKEWKDLEEALKKPENGFHTLHFAEFPRVVYIDAIAMERDNLALLSGAFRVTTLKRID
jgi:S1-C subfamily serine protease